VVLNKASENVGSYINISIPNIITIWIIGAIGILAVGGMASLLRQYGR
jgi:hypothetical protein